MKYIYVMWVWECGRKRLVGGEKEREREGRGGERRGDVPLIFMQVKTISLPFQIYSPSLPSPLSPPHLVLIEPLLSKST